MKRFAAAKQRLDPGLDEERRVALAEAMLGDVLEAIGEARMVDRTIVVTGEPSAQQAAATAGADVVPDPLDEGQPAATMLGIQVAIEGSAGCAVLLPGDCPLLEPRELDGLLTGIPERFVTIVPDRHGTGTNALVLSPPDAIRPAFGEESCERHVEAARSGGIPYVVERVDSLALDLDTPADIVALTRQLEGGRGRATRTAKALGI